MRKRTCPTMVNTFHLGETTIGFVLLLYALHPDINFFSNHSVPKQIFVFSGLRSSK